MSDLVGNPEDRFSRVAAHTINYSMTFYSIIVIPLHASMLKHCTNPLFLSLSKGDMLWLICIKQVWFYIKQMSTDYMA